MKKILVLLGTEPQNGGEHQYALTIMECLVKDCCKDVMLSAICRNRYWRNTCFKYWVVFIHYVGTKISS